MALVVTSAPFQQVNMPALDLRRSVGVGRAEGIIAGGDMAVAQRAAGANLSVDIAAGEAFVQGDSITNQGLYYAYNDAVFNLTGFTAAHATLPRVDRVALRIRDAFHGDAANDEAFVVLTGTATTGATLTNLTGAPAVPGSHLLLANVLIPATATSITTANIDTTVRVRAAPPLGPLYDTTLAATAASIDIPNIPQLYAHLRIEIHARSDTAIASEGLFVRINNDSGANYRYQYLAGNGATVSTAQTTGAVRAQIGSIPGGSAAANRYGATSLVIPHYRNTSGRKMILSHSGLDTGAGGAADLTDLHFFALYNDASNLAVSRLTFYPGSNNFIVDTRVTIYALGS